MPLPPSRRGVLSVTNMSPFPRAAQTRNYRPEGRSAILNRELIWKRSSASSFMGAPDPAVAMGKASKREAISPQSDGADRREKGGRVQLVKSGVLAPAGR